MMSGSEILEFSESECADFGYRAFAGRHRMHKVDLFDDEALISLLDTYPRPRLQAFTMGTDSCRRDDWRYVDIGNASGKQIFAAVARGRLWLNLLRVDLADRRYAELMARLQAELVEKCPRLELLSIHFGTLLISSPTAFVYYHLDTSHQALWHLRGSKRIFIYPACDERFVSRETLEDMFAGAYGYDEEIPYSSGFDDHAAVFDLAPGDVASWPHNAPHRIENLGTLNVSLSTGFLTEASYKRGLVYCANRFFRRRLRLPLRSVKESGPAATAKCLAYRIVRRVGLVQSQDRQPYSSNLRIDPEAPLGFREHSD